MKYFQYKKLHNFRKHDNFNILKVSFEEITEIPNFCVWK